MRQPVASRFRQPPSYRPEPLHKKIREAGGKLVLCELRPVMKEILDGARLNKLFDITEDEENALERFAAVDE